jgi:hypothetical protein
LPLPFRPFLDFGTKKAKLFWLCGNITGITSYQYLCYVIKFRKEIDGIMSKQQLRIVQFLTKMIFDFDN